MPLSSRRSLLRALTISLLVHGALLTSVPKPFRVTLDAPFSTLTVTVPQNNPGELSKPIGTSDTKPTPPVKSSKPLIRKRAEEQLASPTRSAALAAERYAPATTPDFRPEMPTSMGQASHGGGAANTSAVIRASVNADDMRQYRLSLAKAARRFKRYPALARERGWEGATEVALRLTALMSEPEVELVNSSGRSVLDEQALEMIRQAARITLLPEGLKGREFRILLPVKFSLEGDQ